MAELVIRNARITNEANSFSADIEVNQGIITAICALGTAGAGEVEIDANGLDVLPGCIDMHVHFNDPGFIHREDFASGTRAVAAGGITMVVDMPLAGKPTVINTEAVLAKKNAVASKAYVDYCIWGGLVDNNIGEMAAMAKEGIAGFKAFMADAGPDFPFVQNDVLLAGMLKAKQLGSLIALHCEDDKLVKYLEEQEQSRGNTDVPAFLRSRPPYTETIAVNTAVTLAAAAGARVHICHASLAASVAIVEAARDKAPAITIETCPHYLVLDTEDFKAIGPVAKCSPPIRSREEVEALWGKVFDGSLDVIGSDHSPSTCDEKEAGKGNIWQAWGGINGVQTMIPLLLEEGVRKRGLPLKRLVQLVSANPAKILGIYPRKGTIQVGSDADFTLIDREGDWEITKESLYYKNRHSPYLGKKGKGKVVATIVRGRLVYHDEKIIGNPGFGRYIEVKN